MGTEYCRSHFLGIACPTGPSTQPANKQITVHPCKATWHSEKSSYHFKSFQVDMNDFEVEPSRASNSTQLDLNRLRKVDFATSSTKSRQHYTGLHIHGLIPKAVSGCLGAAELLIQWLSCENDEEEGCDQAVRRQCRQWKRQEQPQHQCQRLSIWCVLDLGRTSASSGGPLPPEGVDESNEIRIRRGIGLGGWKIDNGEQYHTVKPSVQSVFGSWGIVIAVVARVRVVLTSLAFGVLGFLASTAHFERRREGVLVDGKRRKVVVMILILGKSKTPRVNVAVCNGVRQGRNIRGRRGVRLVH
ncbi:hypothetical protein K438DRAFT_1753520 [Mycena galopus ATCC 62051]|nr:hypothetical protein K438DRAFT_1753520 [Mycena galopus ATCC 62051]